MFAAGSVPWLVWWDLRIRIRSLGYVRFSNASRVVYAVLFLLLHALAGLLLWSDFQQPPSSHAADAVRNTLIGSLTAILLLMMLLAAMFSALRLVLSGPEMSLHLSSPIPFDRVLRAKVLMLVLSTWAIVLWLVMPLANVGAVLGHPVFLLLYPVTLAFAACVTAVSLLIVAAVLRTFGPQRARKMMQYLQAAIPLGFVVLSVFRQTGRPETAASRGRVAEQQVNAVAALFHPLDIPIRALQGDIDALAIIALLTSVLVWLALRVVRGIVLTALLTPEAAAKPKKVVASKLRSGRFGGSLFRNLFLKEWRTLLREPRFAAALLVQPVALLPLFYINIFRGNYKLVGAVAATTFVAAQMSQYVANLMISAEEAPGLLCAAPVPRSRLIACKCLTALLPIWLLMLCPITWLAQQNVYAALICLLCSLGASFCACALEVARPYPVPRRSFVQMAAARHKRDPLDIIGVLVLQFGWTGAAALLALNNIWGALVILVLLLVPFFGWWRDANRQSLLGY